MIHVVTGHVCSGKSTFVRDHAQPGDVVIDLDRIALALTTEGTQDHDYPHHVAQIAIAARYAAIDEAVRRSRADGSFDVWLIHAYPEDRDWATYRRLGAAVYTMEADPETLRQRAAAGRPDRVRRLLEERLEEERKSVFLPGKEERKSVFFPGKTAQKTCVFPVKNAVFGGVGSAGKPPSNGTPRVPSARISGEF